MGQKYKLNKIFNLDIFVCLTKIYKKNILGLALYIFIYILRNIYYFFEDIKTMVCAKIGE